MDVTITLNDKEFKIMDNFALNAFGAEIEEPLKWIIKAFISKLQNKQLEEQLNLYDQYTL